MSNTPRVSAPFDALSPVAQEVAEVMARVASDIALVIDRDGVICSVAEGASPLPADCSSWVGQRWVDTASSDTRRKIELLLDEISTGGVSQRREVNHPVIDGDSVPMAWTAVSLGGQGPVVAVGRDLRTVAAIQRRFLDAQHEMELDYWQRRHADSRYQTLFHVARDAVLVLDAATFNVVDANDAAQALFVQPTGQTQTLIERVTDMARASLAELLTTARSSGRAGEVRLRFSDKGPEWDVSATPFVVAEQMQILVRARDREATDGAGAQPGMMRALVESTPDAVVITDSAGHILLTNPAFLALVQQESESMVKGQSLADVVGDHNGAWRKTIARTRQLGLCTRTPLAVAHGGLDISVEVSSTLLADSEDDHLGFMLRTVEPPRPVSVSSATGDWHELHALRAQVGLLPLSTLLREGNDAIERQMIRTALRMASGKVMDAARLLTIEPHALSLRIQCLDLASHGADDDGIAASKPQRMN